MKRDVKAEVVRRLPGAMAEKHVDNGGNVYWLIRPRGQRNPFADGDSRAQAWRNALSKLEARGRGK